MSEFAKVEAVEKPSEDPRDGRIRRTHNRVTIALLGIFALGCIDLFQLGLIVDLDGDHFEIKDAVQDTPNRTPTREDLAKTIDELKREIESFRRDLTQVN